MKCREFEERIYLYDELIASERTIMDEHRSLCAPCGQLAGQFFRTQELIKTTRSIIPAPPHPQRLTNRIMKAIEVKERVSFLDELVYYLNSLITRYAVSALSIFLIVYFLYEQQSTPPAITVSSVSAASMDKGTVLDLSKFNTSYVKQREIRRGNQISKYAYYKSEQAQKNF